MMGWSVRATTLVTVAAIGVEIFSQPAWLALVPVSFALLHVVTLAALARGRQQLAAGVMVWGSLPGLAGSFALFGGIDGFVPPILTFAACVAALWLEPVPAALAVAAIALLAPVLTAVEAIWPFTASHTFTHPILAEILTTGLMIFLAAALVGRATDELVSASHAADRRAVDAHAAERRAIGSSEAKARFLAMMSHELRTPLNAILGYTDLLREDTPDAIELLRISAAGHVLLELVDDVLEVARAESAPRPLVPEVVDVRRLFAEVIAARDDGGPEIVVHGPCALSVQVDRVYARRILVNVARHAARSRATTVDVHLVSQGPEGVRLTFACPGPPDVWLLVAQRLARQSGSTVEARETHKVVVLRPVGA